jgi:hypothetical protein
MGKGSKQIASQVPHEKVAATWTGAFGEYRNPNFPKDEEPKTNKESKDETVS